VSHFYDGAKAETQLVLFVVDLLLYGLLYDKSAATSSSTAVRRDRLSVRPFAGRFHFLVTNQSDRRTELRRRFKRRRVRLR